MLEDIALQFKNRKQSAVVEKTTLEYGRIETRRIWVTGALNGYLDFPHVAQAFVIERERIEETPGKRSTEFAYRITSRPPGTGDKPWPLAREQLPLHHRLEFRRGPQPDTNRSRTGEYRPLTSLCRWHHQIQRRTQRRSENAVAKSEYSVDLRLPADVEKCLPGRLCVREDDGEKKFALAVDCTPEVLRV